MTREYEQLDSGRNGTTPDFLEALAFIRAIYWPKPKAKGQLAYFVTPDEIDHVTINALARYGIDTIRKFYEYAEANGMLGMRDSWVISAVEDDIETFLGRKTESKPNPSPIKKPFTDEEQASRYFHLIYAPNVINVDILKEKPIEQITLLSQMMLKKYGFKAVETLIDYCIFHRLTPRKMEVTQSLVEDDMRAAIKWACKSL
jgi:hypothetical protein